MLSPEHEQELRDAMLRAMSACDKPEVDVITAQMLLVGMDAETIMVNIFLDLQESERDWWLEPEPGRIISVEYVCDRINEAARRELSSPSFSVLSAA